MSFNMNMSYTRRVWRHYGSVAANATIQNVELVRFEKSKLTFNFLTAHPSDELSSRCVVPYYELPIYRTQGPMTIPGRIANAWDYVVA